MRIKHSRLKGQKVKTSFGEVTLDADGYVSAIDGDASPNKLLTLDANFLAEEQDFDLAEGTMKVITPSDTVDLAPYAKGIIINAWTHREQYTPTLKLLPADNTSDDDFVVLAVNQGMTRIDIPIRRVFETGSSLFRAASPEHLAYDDGIPATFGTVVGIYD